MEFHQGKVLVTSSQTGFDVDYLVELASRIQISSVTFEGKHSALKKGDQHIKKEEEFVELIMKFSSQISSGEAKTFNRFHSPNVPTDVRERRINLCRKRLSDGYFTFIYLELCQQLGITDYQVLKY